MFFSGLIPDHLIFDKTKERDQRSRPIDVEEEMKVRADELALENLATEPNKIAKQILREMTDEHGISWVGLGRDQIIGRVRRARANMNHGDAFRTVENTTYAKMTDSNEFFLQKHECWPDRSSGVLQRIMAFANPALLYLLQSLQVDIFIDGTFKVCPSPFTQCLIIMVFDRATYLYIPVMYILMTCKTEEGYWYAFSSVIACSDWRINVRNFHADFEKALINAAKKQFSEADFIGCLFHWKQAIQRYLISKLGFLRAEIAYAMRRGVLDLLTIIPMDEVEKIGIPFVRSMIEKVRRVCVLGLNLDYHTPIFVQNMFLTSSFEPLCLLLILKDLEEDKLLKWKKFWEDYFIPYWVRKVKVESWNICFRLDEFLEVQQRANNALENYNGRYGDLFSKQPSLLEYVEITERESRDQVQQLRMAQTHHSKRKVYKEAMPAEDAVPKAYKDFAAEYKKKKKAARKKKRTSAD